MYSILIYVLERYIMYVNVLFTKLYIYSLRVECKKCLIKIVEESK